MISAPKADALPGCATPRHPVSLGNCGVEGNPESDVRGNERKNTAGTGEGSPGIVPNAPPTLHIQFSDDGEHIRKWSREAFDGGVEYVRVDRVGACVCDGVDDPEPTCVIDTNDHHDCIFAKEGMARTDCEYWQNIILTPTHPRTGEA